MILTPLVVAVPARLASLGVILHVALVTQDREVLWRLVPLVTISVMNVESLCRAALLARPYRRPQSRRPATRQAVIAGIGVPG